jgi:hypothetical protein
MEVMTVDVEVKLMEKKKEMKSVGVRLETVVMVVEEEGTEKIMAHWWWR